MSPDLIFVYGTLKRGERNHGLLARAEFIGGAFTEPKYRLIDCGPYPALVEHSEQPMAIGGEVYRIDEAILRELDRLEDEGRLYRRAVIEAQMIDGPACDQTPRSAQVWTYFWLRTPPEHPLIEAASWTEKR